MKRGNSIREVNLKGEKMNKKLCLIIAAAISIALISPVYADISDEGKAAEGYLLSCITKTQDGELEEVTAFSYDGQGNLISKVIKDAQGNLKNLTEYQYENGLLVYSVFAIETTTEKYYYTYDEQGRVVKEIWYFQLWEDGNIELNAVEFSLGYIGYSARQTEYQYDDDGNLAFTETHFGDFYDGGTFNDEMIRVGSREAAKFLPEDPEGGNEPVHTDYTYDAAGNLIEKKETDLRTGNGDQNKVRLYSYQYDDKGNCLVETWIENGEKSREIYREYDDNGNKIKETYYNAAGEETAKYTYTYTDSGSLSVRSSLKADGTTSNYGYLYDEEGREIVRGTQEPFDGEVKAENFVDGGNRSSYDDAGNLIQFFIPSGRNSNTEKIYEYEYIQITALSDPAENEPITMEQNDIELANVTESNTGDTEQEPASTVQLSESDQEVYMAAAVSLNVRDSAVSGNVLVVLQPGETVQVLEIIDGWAHIIYNGIDGYCAAEFLQ